MRGMRLGTSSHNMFARFVCILFLRANFSSRIEFVYKNRVFLCENFKAHEKSLRPLRHNGLMKINDSPLRNFKMKIKKYSQKNIYCRKRLASLMCELDVKAFNGAKQTN